MEKPLCRFCGYKHYTTEPHRFGIDRDVKSPCHIPVKTITPEGALEVFALTEPTEIVNTNVAEQLRWRAGHRDEFNRKRRERYQKRKKGG